MRALKSSEVRTIVAVASNAGSQTSADFSGQWVLRLGNRVLIVVTLAPPRTPGSNLGGWLARPKYFNSSGAGEFFSHIRGSVVHYPII